MWHAHLVSKVLHSGLNLQAIDLPRPGTAIVKMERHLRDAVGPALPY